MRIKNIICTGLLSLTLALTNSVFVNASNVTTDSKINIWRILL